MRRVTVIALKHLLLGFGFLLTLTAFALIAAAFLYLSLGINKQLLEKYLSEQVQRPVEIESIETGWNGLLAEMRATGIHVLHEDGTQSTLRLRELQVSVDPLYLLGGSLRVEKTVVYGLSLELARRADGTISVGDFAFAEQEMSDSRGLDWLRGQGDIEVREGQIIWRDQRDADHPIAVTEFNVETRSDDRQIRFTGRASPPTELGNQVYFNGVVRGLLMQNEVWSGDINLSLSRLNIERLPLVLREFIPWQTKGFADMRLKTRWQSGEMTYANGDVELARFVVPSGEGGKDIPVQKFETTLALRRYPDSWSLSLINPRLAVSGRWFKTKGLKIESTQDTYKYTAEGMQMHEVRNILAQIDTDFPGRDLVQKSRAYGVLRNVTAVTEGPLFSPNQWSVDGEFQDVSWVPFDGAPGVSGVNGSMHIRSGEGRLNINSDDVEIHSPGRLEPLFFSRLEAAVDWSRHDGGWLIDINDLRLDNSHLRRGRGNIGIHLFDDGGRPLYVSGEFAVEQLRAGKFWQYLPRGGIPDKTIAWFKKALVGGTFADLNVSLAGPIKEFPFRSGRGSFSLTTQIKNGRFHYKDGWPDIDEIVGTLSIDNAGLKGEVASAKFNRSTVNKGQVNSADVFSKKRELFIEAGLNAPAKDIVWFLTEGPLLEQKSSLDITADGEGQLDLSIFLPLSDVKNRLEVVGRYVTQDTAVTIKDRFVLSELNGAVEFTDTTVEASGITGRLMEGDARIAIETIEPGRPPIWTAYAEGSVDSSRLLPLLGSSMLESKVSGTAAWVGSLTAEPGRTTLRIESDLEGVEVSLPEPLSKRSEDKRESSLKATFERAGEDFEFKIEPLLGRLDYRKQNNERRLSRGMIAVGKENASLASGEGVRISIAQQSFDADAWLALANADAEDSGAESKSDWWGVNGIDLEVAKLRLFARDWDRVRAKAASPNGFDWNAWVSGDAFLGEVALHLDRDEQPGRYVMRFDRLHVPKAIKQKTRPSPPTRPNRYPTLDIRADRFKYGDWDLGELRLLAGPRGGEWRIEKLIMDQPGLNIDATGKWVKDAGATNTRINARVNSDDVAVALARLRLPPHMAEADVRMQLDLHWPGDPASFRLGGLNGNFDITATEGRFLNVEPGSGRLLGLFNIDAISRRFSLDFSDIFSKGLAFDQIKGEGTINRGNLYTDGLFVVGPSAIVEIDGRTGLESEDYDLEVVVVPQLGSHISMLSALANPIAGAMVFIAQKVMKKTFNKLLTEMAHYRYKIEGSWEEPVITSVLLEPASEEESMR